MLYACKDAVLIGSFVNAIKTTDYMIPLTQDKMRPKMFLRQ